MQYTLKCKRADGTEYLDDRFLADNISEVHAEIRRIQAKRETDPKFAAKWADVKAMYAHTLRDDFERDKMFAAWDAAMRLFGIKKTYDEIVRPVILSQRVRKITHPALALMPPQSQELIANGDATQVNYFAHRLCNTLLDWSQASPRVTIRTCTQERWEDKVRKLDRYFRVYYDEETDEIQTAEDTTKFHELLDSQSRVHENQPKPKEVRPVRKSTAARKIVAKKA